jgi:metal-dependent amidase/aminoacylase/carboxypeptidase family protein
VLKEGVLDDVQAIFGLHVGTGMPVGTVGSRPGTFLAGSASVHDHHRRERWARGGAPARCRSHRRGVLCRAQPSAARRSRDRSASGRCTRSERICKFSVKLYSVWLMP